MSVFIYDYSRLRFGSLLSYSGVEFWDLPDLPKIPVQTDDISYMVTANERVDLLANKYYGDPVLWWVIAVANGHELLPTALNEGETIRIPSPRYVLRELFQKIPGA
jgi:hypothetical protein